MARIVRWILIGIRLITPWVIKFAWFMFNLALKAMASFWVGVPKSIRNLASQWTAMALNSGIPSIYDVWIFRIMAVVASLMILAGWIIASHLTVWLFWLVF